MGLQLLLAINELPWLKAFRRFSIEMKPINMASALVLMDTGECESGTRVPESERKREKEQGDPCVGERVKVSA